MILDVVGVVGALDRLSLPQLVELNLHDLSNLSHAVEWQLWIADFSAGESPIFWKSPQLYQGAKILLN